MVADVYIVDVYSDTSDDTGNLQPRNRAMDVVRPTAPLIDVMPVDSCGYDLNQHVQWPALRHRHFDRDKDFWPARSGDLNADLMIRNNVDRIHLIPCT